MLKDHKLNPASFSGKNVKALPNNPSANGITAAALKAAFDRGGEEVIANAFNASIDTLTSIEGAANIGTVGGSDVQSHIDDKNNPHAVTALQVGLGSVNNTSDIDKPISFLTKAAIDDLSANVLTKNNITPYEPTADYHPVTLKKLNDTALHSGSVSSVFGQAGMISKLDCGEWDMESVALHNQSALAHSNIVLDGLQSAPSQTDIDFDKHKVNKAAHENINLNGGVF